MPHPHSRILVIDDDVAILNLYADALSPQYQVTAVPDWLDGTDLLLSKSFDLLILDLRMSFFDPVEFIKRVRSDSVRLPILVSSADINLRERVSELDVDAVLAKPFTLTELERAVSQLLISQ